MPVQVRHRGAWHEVPPKEGAFVVNVGDLLHRWTGGRFKCVPGAHHASTSMRSLNHCTQIL